MIAISSKPGIRVQVRSEAGSLTRVSLFSSSGFTFDTQFCDQSLIEAMTRWLKSYAQGKLLPLPLLTESLPDSFRRDVLRFLQTIPWGSVLSYQEVAKATGSPRAARAVGNICRGNTFPLMIPCHRVIRSDGGIGCYTPDPLFKRKLLYFEGVAGVSD